MESVLAKVQLHVAKHAAFQGFLRRGPYMVVTFILVNVSSMQEEKALVRLCVNAGLSEPCLFSSRIKSYLQLLTMKKVLLLSHSISSLMNNSLHAMDATR